MFVQWCVGCGSRVWGWGACQMIYIGCTESCCNMYSARLLPLGLQEFMKVIQEYGKVFSLDEYRSALELIGRSQQKDVSKEREILFKVFSADAV